MSGQKLIKNAKNGQTVLPDTPDRSLLIGQKLVKIAKIKKNPNETFWVIFKHCAEAE